MNGTIVQFGAGAIGRGFLGQLWTEAGFTVCFVEVDADRIALLNQRGGYPLRLLDGDRVEERVVEGVQAINGQDREAVAGALSHCVFACTAVGVAVFPHLASVLADGIRLRASRNPEMPLNILCCENQNHAGDILRTAVSAALPQNESVRTYFADQTAFVDASVGRMVPPPTPELLAEDPLLIAAEPYRNLPIDGDAWIGSIPPIPDLLPKTNFTGYVARKLFTHNGGHATLAYHGWRKGYETIADALADGEIDAELRGFWAETGPALIARYALDAEEQRKAEADLWRRFGNRALGDTVVRVGRDPKRKLRSDDRLVGAAKLFSDVFPGKTPDAVCRAIAAALRFDPPDDVSAQELQSLLRAHGIAKTLDLLMDSFESLRSLMPKITKEYNSMKPPPLK